MNYRELQSCGCGFGNRHLDPVTRYWSKALDIWLNTDKRSGIFLVVRSGNPRWRMYNDIFIFIYFAMIFLTYIHSELVFMCRSNVRNLEILILWKNMILSPFIKLLIFYYNNSDAPSKMFHVPLKSTFCLGQMLWFDTVKKYDNSLLRSSSHILFRYWETNVVPLLWNLRSLCMFSSNLLILYELNFYSVNKYDFFSCYLDANAYRLPQGWLWILTLSVRYMFSWKRRFCAGQMCVDYLY